VHFDALYFIIFYIFQLLLVVKHMFKLTLKVNIKLKLSRIKSIMEIRMS